jgi:hypothetical protein
MCHINNTLGHVSAVTQSCVYKKFPALTRNFISRSPSAYELNPESERQQWSKMGNTDKFITLLKFVNADGVGKALYECCLF